VVVFWSPTCGFCHDMLPDLRARDADRPAHAPRLLIVSSGLAEPNRPSA
jgi:protein-disulfide isomerase